MSNRLLDGLVRSEWDRAFLANPRFREWVVTQLFACPMPANELLHQYVARQLDKAREKFNDVPAFANTTSSASPLVLSLSPPETVSNAKERHIAQASCRSSATASMAKGSTSTAPASGWNGFKTAINMQLSGNFTGQAPHSGTNKLLALLSSFATLEASSVLTTTLPNNIDALFERGAADIWLAWLDKECGRQGFPFAARDDAPVTDPESGANTRLPSMTDKERLSDSMSEELNISVDEHLEGFRQHSQSAIISYFHSPSEPKILQDQRAAATMLIYRRSISHVPALVCNSKWMCLTRTMSDDLFVPISINHSLIANYMVMMLNVEGSLKHHRGNASDRTAFLRLCTRYILFEVWHMAMHSSPDQHTTWHIFFLLSSLQTILSRYPAACNQIIAEERSIRAKSRTYLCSLATVLLWIDKREKCRSPVDVVRSALVLAAVAATSITLELDLLLPPALTLHLTALTKLSMPRAYMYTLKFFDEYRLQKKARIRVCCSCGIYRHPNFPLSDEDRLWKDPFKVCSL